MTKIVMMVGLPASGKSTLSETLAKEFGAIIVSSDAFIENEAKIMGKTYNEVFSNRLMKSAEKHVKGQVQWAIVNQVPIIWDQTNLSKEVRVRRLSMIPTTWHRTCVNVICQDEAEHTRRLNSRPGKTIPVNVIERMREQYVKPTTDEGFDEVVEVVN